MMRRGSFLSGGIQNHSWEELPGRVLSFIVSIGSVVRYYIEAKSGSQT